MRTPEASEDPDEARLEGPDSSVLIMGAALVHAPEDDVAGFYRQVFGWAESDGVMYSDDGAVARLIASDEASPGWIPVVATGWNELRSAAVARGCRFGSLGPYELMTDPRGTRVAIEIESSDRPFAFCYSPTDATPGRMCWLQLNAHEPTASGTLYRSLFGWGRAESSNHLFTYEDFTRAGEPYAGLMQIDERSGDTVPELWQVYFRTDDVRATTEATVDAGGSVLVPVTRLLDVTFSVVSDRYGSIYAVERHND